MNALIVYTSEDLLNWEWNDLYDIYNILRTFPCTAILKKLCQSMKQTM